jgi:hypothetical protein
VEAAEVVEYVEGAIAFKAEHPEVGFAVVGEHFQLPPPPVVAAVGEGGVEEAAAVEGGLAAPEEGG